MSAIVVALAGTDHHPFDRLVDWMDEAATRRPDLRFVVQHGATRAPRVAEGHAFLTHDDLVGLLRSATVVVCHGGPGTIMDARDAGHVPVCVPRDPSLGEHVDGHQQRFATMVAGAGVVRLAPSLERFHEELDNALLSASDVQALDSTRQVRDQARGALAAELDHLIASRPRRSRRRQHART